ncbi:MAG: MnhB domain-containing protein [Pseudomonadota bacterium]|nr:MnhB domain-containing protein [Pseudomonadota bacterium]
MYRVTSLLFAVGLTVLLFALVSHLDFGHAPMVVGESVNRLAAEQTGAANFVTAVVLGYRGIDTLGELAILFAAATAAGLVLGHKRSENSRREADGGAILIYGADLFFPLLLVVGLYIILHGHLTPGGGFQGGVILAAAFFVPVLARPGGGLNHRALSIVEGLAGASFIVIGLWGLWGGGEFLQPMLDKGTLGELVSAGTLPLLYLAVGLKVGAELAGLLTTIAETEANE